MSSGIDSTTTTPADHGPADHGLSSQDSASQDSASPAPADRAPADHELADHADHADRAARGADALPEPPAARADLAAIDDVEEAMRDVVDPELGINVVDLGLVYDIRVEDDNVAIIDMTLTSAACPLTDVIEEQARGALVRGPGGGLVTDLRINWVWMPPWGPEKITDDGREQLRALGFTV